MYKIKQICKDFVVTEQIELDLTNSGKYAYYMLKKRNYSTIKAIEVVSRNLKVREKHINFAGAKDKVADTKQVVSISQGPKKSFGWEDISLKYLGNGDDRINLGSHNGNEFKITIRNIKNGPDLKKLVLIKKKHYVLNIFDEQRFGVNNDTHIIGKYIIKKEFRKAAMLIPKLQSMLKKNPNDFIGALRSLPKKQLQLYVHAYQSFLWNIVAKKINIDDINKKIPLLGFGTEFNDIEIKKEYDDLVDKEGIILRDFIMRQMPELILDGDMRKMYVEVKDLIIGNLTGDEMNPSKNKCIVSFFLEKGAYATNVIRILFG